MVFFTIDCCLQPVGEVFVVFCNGYALLIPRDQVAFLKEGRKGVMLAKKRFFLRLRYFAAGLQVVVCSRHLRVKYA